MFYKFKIGSRWFKMWVQDEKPYFMGRFKMVQDKMKVLYILHFLIKYLKQINIYINNKSIYRNILNHLEPETLKPLIYKGL